jgi:hypothetical protein
MLVGTSLLTRAIVDGAFTPRAANGDGLAGRLGEQVRRAFISALKPIT